MSIVNVKNYGLVVRDSPNLIMPTLADPISYTPGETWGNGAYAQVIAAASLTYPFILHDLIVNGNLGTYLITQSTAAKLFLMQHEIGTGAAASEVSKAVAIDAEGLYVGLSWDTAGVGVEADIYCTTSKDIPIGPLYIPPSTRIAFRSSLSTTAAFKTGRVYLSGYNVNTLDFTKHFTVDELLERGSRATYPSPLVFLGSVAVTGGAGWTAGNYAQIIAALSDDYLLVSAHAIPTDATGICSAQFDVSIGAAGSEAVQAKFALPETTLKGAVHMRWPYPVIAYKGERIAVRAAPGNSGKAYTVNIYGVRLA